MIQLDFLNLFEQPYKLPSEYIGKLLTKNKLTKFQARKWTIEEENHAMDLRKKGLSIAQIAESLNRDKVQVSIKIKRLLKKSNQYNEMHREEKYYNNDIFLNAIQPQSVLDLYAGAVSYYEDKVNELYTNDINKTFNTYYSEDAKKLCNDLLMQNYSFDLVDVDPFGSAYDCIESSIQLAKKGLIITFGELGHKRFKRLDFVKDRYNCLTLDNFTAEHLSQYVINKALNYNKELELFILKKWHNIARAYYIIK